MKLSVSLFIGMLLLVPGPSVTQVRRQAAAGKVDETTRVINDCEKRTNTFKRSVRSKARGDAPNLQRDVEQLEEALNKVGDSWNRDHNMQATRSYVTAAIALAQQINRFMTTYHGTGDLVNQWAAVRTEINRLAQTFRLPMVRW